MDEKYQESLLALTQRLGTTISDLSLLEQALTHSSFTKESPDLHATDYERLEYLGDAVLDLAMSHILMEQFPALPPGELSKIRAAAVNSKTLTRLALRLDLGPHIRLSRGEEQTAGREKSSILADIFEAVLGAIYMDAGFDRSLQFVREQFSDMFLSPERLLIFDYKTRLQELTQAEFHQAPQYSIVSALGPDHDKEFVVEVFIGGKKYGEGSGRSKKDADQAAARNAFINLKGSDPLDNQPFFPKQEEG